MKVAAFQFEISDVIENNFIKIQMAVSEAKKQGVSLIVFPECCLTGYPPIDIPDSKSVDFDEVEKYCKKLMTLSRESDICIIAGTVYREKGHIFNRALVFCPDGSETHYDKRALYGWDSDNFESGSQQGVFEVQGVKIGVRICFEIRFPEYFRELYREQTDINIVLFYDVSDHENKPRYEMIKGHIQTRAVENVTTTVSVNAANLYRTAPTAVFDRSGMIRGECGPKEELLLYEYVKENDNFGETGRRIISNRLVGDKI